MKTLKLIGLIAGFLVSCASANGPKKDLLCEVSGCNGEICSQKGRKMISPCVVLPQHQCLKKSRCEVQETGICGWTKTPDYLECMKQFQPK